MNQSFPVKDLLRRRFQTSLTITILTLSVASTLFLLFFSSRIGLSISSNQGTLTLGLSALFSQFMQFIGVLIFIVGGILTSFIIFLMLTQRTRDFGLIKAAGCPNALVAGYFMTELLIVTVSGCILGVVFGLITDYMVAILVFHFYTIPNLWFILLIFAIFLVLSLFFGTRPILKAAKMSPIKALSSTIYYGLTSEKRHKPLSRTGITWQISLRSLVRRQSSTVRIIVLLSAVFILLTVSISGGIIANNTTKSWVEESVNPNTLIIAHNSMNEAYKRLLATFSGSQNSINFNYSDQNLAVSDTVIEQLKIIADVEKVDARLILKEEVQEISNFTIDNDSGATFSVGDNRKSDSIIIGIDPGNMIGSLPLKGQFLSNNSVLEAVIGDSISNIMYSVDSRRKIMFSDPLLQSIRIQNTTFRILGVCVDQMNNGLTTYVPISKLKDITGISNPNIIFITLKNDVDRDIAIDEIKTSIQSIDSDLDVFTLNDAVNNNLNFLASIWSAIMLLPFLTLISASLCLVGYSILTIEEQHQELGILRAIGTKPNVITRILSIQSIIILLSSLGFGISLGTMFTLMVLMANPVVTIITIIEITAWILVSLTIMFLLCLYPAFKLAKMPILKMLT